MLFIEIRVKKDSYNIYKEKDKYSLVISECDDIDWHSLCFHTYTRIYNSVEEAKQIAQQHFENQIKQYLES